MTSMELSERLRAALGNQYQLERELGGGGMSRIFVARDTALKRDVVAKVLPPELAAGVSVERFKREILIGASLQHPHIVPVLSAGEVDGLPFYVMPLVRGESLRERLERAPAVKMREGLSVLRDVARALAYAHRAGVVHRDVKPENVLLTDGIAVVADFGIAKALARSGPAEEKGLTGTGISIGTPMYMAPEQIAGDPDTDHRADLYAFGVMAYEVLSGRPPFEGRTPRELLSAQMVEVPSAIEDVCDGVPAGVARLVGRCLAKHPDERPATADELISELDAALSDSGDLAAALSGEPRRIVRVIASYSVASAAMIGATWLAMASIGLPDWVVTGAVLLAIAGLPVVAIVSAARLAAYRGLVPRANQVARRPESWDRWMRIAVVASRQLTWKRVATAGVVAFSAFGTMVAAYMTLRALGLGPAGSLLARGTLERAGTILVSDFGSVSEDSTLARLTTEAVRVGLQQSNAVRVMPQQGVAAALQRMRRERGERVTGELAQEIARREGVRAIVTGDLVRSGDELLVTVNLVSADSGHNLARASAFAANPADLLRAVDRTTRDLRSRIGESLKRVRATPPLERVTTASMQALDRFTQGAHANDIEGDFPKAIALLKEAVAIDTAFASAWRKLGIAYSNGRLGPPGAAAGALARAYRHRNRLTDEERWYTEAAYYVGQDRAKAIAAYEQLLMVDSGNVVNIAGLLLSRREFRRTEELLRWQIRNHPDSPHPYYNFFRSLLNQGKAREADSASDAVATRLPALAAARAEVMCAVHDRAACKRALDGVRASGAPQQRAEATTLLLQLSLTQGQLRRADALLRELNQLERARGGAGIGEVALTTRANRIDTWITRRPELVLRRLDSSNANAVTESARAVNYATQYAAAGHVNPARALLARVARQSPDSGYPIGLRNSISLAEAMLASAEDRWGDAISHFRASDVAPDGPANSCAACLARDLAMVYDRASMADSAVIMYERYLATPRFPRMQDDAFLLANTYERLAILNESLGRYAQSLEYAEKFIDLWRDADPELQPRVAAVRELIARQGGLTRR